MARAARIARAELRRATYAQSPRSSLVASAQHGGGMLLAYGLAPPALARPRPVVRRTGRAASATVQFRALATRQAHSEVRQVSGALLYGFVASVEGQLTSPVSARHAATRAPTPQAGEFTRFALEYAAQHPDRPIAILQAGCATAGSELDLPALRAAGHQVLVSLADDDSKPVRAAIAICPQLESAVLGELRSVPLLPRSFDIVQCSMLLDRISHGELVLDRLVGALRPGGLLLLRTADRETAAGFLDRRLPGILRSMAWHVTKPGQPGPFAAVYEPIVSVRGIQAFLLRHGLVVAHRQYRNAAAGGPFVVLAARRLVTWLSLGRLTCSHDELHYVVRKPEDPFARVLP